MWGFIAKLGELRTILILVVLLLIITGPFSGGPVQTSGFALLTTAVAPALYVIMLFVLPLDMTMTRVFMKESEGRERERYRSIIRLEAALLVLMLLSWLPFIVRLLETLL